MKKSSLVMILALVGMVGCHSGKQMKPQKNGMTMRGTEPGQPCVLVGNLVKNCDIDGGVVISKSVECDPLNDFGIKCPAGAKIIGNIGTADGGDPVIHEGIHQKCPEKGCDDPEFYKDAYLNNPISPGNAAVILPKKPLEKADNAGCPVGTIPGIERDGNGVAYSCYAMHKKKPSRWAVTINEVTGHTTISDPKHELRCDYGGPLDPYALSALFTITCWKSVEKAK